MRSSRRVVIALCCAVVLTGCTIPIGDVGEGPSFEDPAHERIFEDVAESLEPAEADAFEATIAPDGEVSEDGEELLERLLDIEEIGTEQRDAVARSVATQGEIDRETLATIDRINASPPAFRADVFRHGLVDTTQSGVLDGEKIAFGLEPDEHHPQFAAIAMALSEGGYEAEELAYLEAVADIAHDEFAWEQADALGLLDVTASDGVRSDTAGLLADTSGDGLIDGTAERLGLDPTAAHPAVAELARPLADGGLGEDELAYLERIGELSAYQGHPYEGWAQADELGLLDETVANGTVTAADLWALENDADNRLLNGMEVVFGTDPDEADTSGDGFADHLKWGPLRDLGMPVHPTEPDVYVEVDVVDGLEHPTDAQFGEIRETLREEPPDDIGPIHVHFFACRNDVAPVRSMPEMHQRTADNRDVRGMGVHYLLLNDGRFEWLGDEWSGVAWLGHYGDPFMLARGDIPAAAETSLIAHELGHKMGIFATDFAGVDSTEYTFDEYNSVMNYNRTDEITFSTGPPFNDYAQMEARNYGSDFESTEELERMWSAGDVPDEALCEGLG